MKKLLSIIMLLTAVSFLPACETLGLAPAQNVGQQIAYGYSTLASVRSTTADLLVAKTIKVEDAKMVQALADDARVSLDIARNAIANGLPKDAQAALTLATSVLQQLQKYLAARKGGS